MYNIILSECLEVIGYFCGNMKQSELERDALPTPGLVAQVVTLMNSNSVG